MIAWHILHLLNHLHGSLAPPQKKSLTLSCDLVSAEVSSCSLSPSPSREDKNHGHDSDDQQEWKATQCCVMLAQPSNAIRF